jgi:CheY-like chemotaxis protein
MSERVLIADHDVRTREFLYELISEVGYGVLTVPVGNEVLVRMKKERPALVILDDTPGEYSGINLARKIREFDKDIRIILLGEDPKPEKMLAQLNEARITTYLKKDFQDPKVITIILSILKQESYLKPSADKKWGNILIVDDEPDNREMLANFLIKRGFSADTAISGEECIEKVRQKNFDVVLLDITMDGMDGILTLKCIKEYNTKIKVIMVTALQSQGLIEEARGFGASDYIVKPFNLGLLESSILSLILTGKDQQKSS